MNATLRTAAIVIATVALIVAPAATSNANDWQTINRFIGWGYSNGYHANNACQPEQPVVHVQAPCSTCAPVMMHPHHHHLGRRIHNAAPAARPAHIPMNYRQR